jgi:DNA invertase Pin-like site-specific DNA recombinase
MIAAVYARKSTDQNLPDAEKSVARQIAHATAYAARKGWTVDPAHVYQDDGISGAEFLKRPGYLALMNALRPRPPFQVLVTMEQSRLGRSLDEVPYALKRITDAGVRVWCYLTDSEVKRESAADKFMVHAIAFVDDMHREQSRERTRDAGGCVYGYRNIRTDGHVERSIDPAQAEVVRRIYRETAGGRGFLRIAQGLNAEGLPRPRGARLGRLDDPGHLLPRSLPRATGLGPDPLGRRRGDEAEGARGGSEHLGHGIGPEPPDHRRPALAGRARSPGTGPGPLSEPDQRQGRGTTNEPDRVEIPADRAAPV